MATLTSAPPPPAAAPDPRPSRSNTRSAPTGRTVALRRMLGLLVVLVPVWWAITYSMPDEGEVVNTGGIQLIPEFLGRAFNPSFDPVFLEVVWEATLTTVAFAALGTAGALVIGALGGLVLSDAVWGRSAKLWLRPIRLLIRVTLIAVRAIHEIIWALLFFIVMGIDPLVAVLAIALPFGAQTAQVFGDTLDNTPRNALLNLRGAGARPTAAVLYGLVPAAKGVLASYSFYRFECAIRSSVVIGFIGVGGLGFELKISLQSRNWDEVWTLIGVVLILSALIDSWSSWIRRDQHVRTCADQAVDAGPTRPDERRSDRKAPRKWSTWSVLIVVPLLVWSWIQTEVSLSSLTSERTRTEGSRLLEEMVPPALPPEGGRVVWDAAWDTIAMAIVAMLVAAVITLIVAPAAMRPVPDKTTDGLVGRIGRYAAWVFARTLLLVLRSIPPTVWAVLALLAFFPGIIPGAIALGLYTGGILGRLVSEAWEAQARDAVRALRSAGVTSSVAGVMAMGPPSVHSMITYTLYRFEICIRDTAIVGVVGAAGLGRLLKDQADVFRYPAIATLLIVSLVISLASEWVSRALRNSLRADNQQPGMLSRVREFRRAS